MSASNTAVSTGLTSRISALSPRLSYRRAVDPDYRAQLFRLRHDAYLREGEITAQPDGQFRDETDEAENTHLFGVHIDGDLISALRVSVGTPEMPDTPTSHVFPDLIEPQIEAGRTVIDPSRLVADLASSRRYPELPYITVRLAWMATAHFDADLLLVAVRPHHVAFYRRLWNTTVVTTPRLYPPLTTAVVLTWVDYRRVRPAVEARYPFLASTRAEREALFGGAPRIPHRLPTSPDAIRLAG